MLQLIQQKSSSQYRYTNSMLFFTERVVKHWTRVPREGVESPSVKVFRSCVGVALGDMV